MASTHELAAKLRAKHAKAGRPKLRTKPVQIAGKDMAKLIKDAQDKPAGGSFFKFEAPGDAIGGTFVSAREEDSKFGPQIKVTLDTKEGPMIFSCTASLCGILADEGILIGTGEGDSRVYKQNPKAKGKKLAVVFRESKASGRGHPFKVFAVSVK